MARVQLYKVQFLVGNGLSAVAGDILDIYCETDDIVTPAFPLSFTDDGIEVDLNGVPLAADDTYSWVGMGPDKVTVQSFNPLVCEGTSLITFTVNPTFWPFASYYSQENHFSCAVNPPTCDLMVVGIPTVTPASDATTADGSISVVASSSLPIQYKLSSDFVYNDGTAQSDGDFSGLLPGQYRIFIRDSANCQVNVLVNLSFANTFGTRFRLEYDDHNGHQTRVDIVKRGYAGVVDQVDGFGEIPFTIGMTLEGIEDKFYPLATLAAEISLLSQTDSKFIEIFTNDPNLYRAVYSKDFGSGFEKLLTSKILKQQYQEDYRFPPYQAKFKANDGLVDLKDYFLIQDDGQKYTGLTSVIKLIAHCLSVNRLELNIRVAINMYAVGMDSTDADDPLDQAYIDFERFYLATSDPTLDFVLKEILRSFRARIVQWEDNWCITRVEEMCDAYDYRLFDKDGEYLSFGTYDPVKELGFPADNRDLILVDRDQNLEIRPSYGTLRVVYNLGLKPNIIRNGDFRLKSQFVNLGTSQGYTLSINTEGFILVNAGYSISEEYEQIDKNNVAYKLTSYIIDALASDVGGQAYIQSENLDLVMGTNNSLRISFRYKISSSYTYINLLILQYFKVRVPYTKVRVLITFDNGTIYYLTADGRWTTEFNEVIFFAEKVDEYIENEILAVQPPGGTTPGEFSIRFYLPFPYYTQFVDVASLKAFDTYDGSDNTLPNGFRTELRNETVVGPGTFSDLYYYVLEQNTDAESLADFRIIRPNDYHATNNPRQWVLNDYASSGDVAIVNPKLTFTTCLDYIRVSYLTDGKDPVAEIIRSTPGESGNKSTLEEEFTLGSYSSLVTTEVHFGIDIGVSSKGIGALSVITTNILLAYLIYTGYYRDADGVGFENWTRDGISESDKLHGIALKAMAAQYKRSSRLLRGSFKARSGFFGFLNVMRNINDSGRIYMPMGLTLNDKRCTYTGEMIELKNIFDPGESSSGSAFTIGFNQAAVR